VSAAAHFVFSTSGVVWAIAVAAAWVVLRPRSAAARRTTFGVALFYLIVSIYSVPMAVTEVVARPYHRFTEADVPRGCVALVIFGAGDEVVEGWDEHVAIPDSVGAARVLEAFRVYGIAKPQWVISSGGNPDPNDTSEPSSTNMKTMLVRLGVPADRIIPESASRETHENAVQSAAILRPLHPDGVVLVTSAVHMRRALGAMRAAGVDAVPAIAPDSWFQIDRHDRLLPSNHGLYYSGEVVHELLGLPYYQLRGWLR